MSWPISLTQGGILGDVAAPPTPRRGSAQIVAESRPFRLCWIVSRRSSRWTSYIWLVPLWGYVALMAILLIGTVLTLGTMLLSGDVGAWLAVLVVILTFAAIFVGARISSKRDARRPALTTSGRLTLEDVHNMAFSKPSRGKLGYNEGEVDEFLKLVEAALQ